jgi:myo-inositol 2-dehydrogenase/D-chiro-inositol 1-dehydrogenase
MADFTRHRQIVPSRREFLKTSSILTAGAVAANTLNIARSAHAAGDDEIKIALIGCGGRGTGAAEQALSTQGKVKLVAMADAFRDRIDQAFTHLSTVKKDLVDVPEERKFVGFDAYQKAIDSGVDLVILTTPPGFRPIQFDAAVKAGKHVFMEKPVATDPAGVRKILASAEEAKQKKLGVGVGLQRHYSKLYQETIKRLQDGEIGDIVAARAYWNTQTPWVKPRQPGQTEMDFQMRNWYYFVWTCGDHIVEQHIHNLDVINWAKGGKYPVKAAGLGGCQVRKGPEYGETFDHHCVEFTYDDGSKLFSQCRHIPGCTNNVSEHAQGTKGTADIGSGLIKGASEWRFRGDNPNPYQVEHDELFASIRSGNPINDAENGAKSSMTAILGRMATYSGQELTWDQALNSTITYMPEKFAWDAPMPSMPDEHGLYKVPMPGITKVV